MASGAFVREPSMVVINEEQMSNSSPRKPKLQIPRPKAKETTPRRTLWALILGVSTILGVPAAVLVVYPRPTVAVSDPVDASDPFSSSVTITNNNYLPLYSATPSLAIVKLVGNGKQPFRSIEDAPGYGSRIVMSAWTGHDLYLDDKFAVALNDFNYPDRKRDILGYADIAVVVKYRIPLLHLEREKIFPFETRQQTNGNFYWYAKTIN